MAGAVKHMERSRRSHNKAQMYGIYNQFHRNAYSVAESKYQRKTLGQRLAALFKKSKVGGN